MATTESLQAFDARLVLYSIDERARRIVAETWPVIAPSLDGAIEEILTAISTLPNVGQIVANNRALLQKLETAHFKALLGGNLDVHYVELVPPHGCAGSRAGIRRAHAQHRR